MGAPVGNRNAAGSRGGVKRRGTMSSTSRLKWMLAKSKAKTKTKSSLSRKTNPARQKMLKEQAKLRRKANAAFMKIHK